jgi:phosphoribosylformylglycinamidine synthase
VDLEAERRAGELVRLLKAEGLITSAHDLSDCGLAVAAAEMALAAGCGVTLAANEALPAAAWFFGEDQGRYLVGCTEADAGRVAEFAQEAGVPVHIVGRIGGETVALDGSSLPFLELREAHESGFAVMMGEA